MNGRLCCTYAGGYASIGTVKRYLSMKRGAVYRGAGSSGNPGFKFNRLYSAFLQMFWSFDLASERCRAVWVARLLLLQLASAHALMTSWWAGLHQPPNAERANCNSRVLAPCNALNAQLLNLRIASGAPETLVTTFKSLRVLYPRAQRFSRARTRHSLHLSHDTTDRSFELARRPLSQWQASSSR